MKKIYFILSTMVLMLLAACSKPVNCRCVVRQTDDNRGLDVRVITVDKHSDCRNIYYVVYDRSRLPEDQGLVDSLICTDYPFDVTVIDSTVTTSNGEKQQ